MRPQVSRDVMRVPPGFGRGPRPPALSVLAAAACVFLVFAIPVEILSPARDRLIEGARYSGGLMRAFRMVVWPTLAVFSVFLWMGFRWAWVATQTLFAVVLLVAAVRFVIWIGWGEGVPWSMFVVMISVALLIYLNTASVKDFCSLRSGE